MRLQSIAQYCPVLYLCIHTLSARIPDERMDLVVVKMCIVISIKQKGFDGTAASSLVQSCFNPSGFINIDSGEINAEKFLFGKYCFPRF